MMEKTFYLYKALIGGTKIKMFDAPMPSMTGNREYEFIGTITLPVTPPLKEVVKEIELKASGAIVGTEKLFGSLWLPVDAYDVKIVYKVKE